MRRNRARRRRQKASEVADPLESMKPFAAAEVVREGCAETPAYADFPMQRLDQDQDEQRHRAAEQGRSAAELASSARSPTGNPR